MDLITRDFIEYFNDYYPNENPDDYRDEIGDFVCKYCDNQDHVNLVLDEIDEYFNI